jgi:hydroxypyruvate isomerase
MAGCIPLEYRSAFVHDGQGAQQTSSQAAQTPGPMLETYLENLAWSAKLAQEEGVTLLIEPINTRDIAHYFLNRQAQAHAVVRSLGAANVKVQMDLYHCQIVEGDLSSKVAEFLAAGDVGHFQIAGVPDRHEPDAGEVFYPALFELIDQISNETGWKGWVGCEYRPRLGAVPGATSAGLGWLKAWRNQT